MLGRVCRRRPEAVTWRRWAGLSSSSGAGDVALVGGFIGVVGGQVTWRRGVVGGRGHRRAHPGLAQYWAVTGVLDGGGAVVVVVVAVVVVVRGKMGWSQCVT